MANIKKPHTVERIRLSTKKGKIGRTFEVRDLREHGFFRIDDQFLDGRWLRLLKGCPSAVYFSLCRHVDKHQRCFPSANYLSEETGYGERHVRRAVSVLEAHRLIEVERERGDHNLYKLLDKRHWRKTVRDSTPTNPIDAMTYVHNEDKPNG
jgi:hypothetical protein